jgi:uncharacterized protein (DUF1015 family)
MAIIRPLAAVRYPAAQQSQLVAPPYDVLSAADKAALLSHNPHNIVAIDLPHIPPKNAGPDAAYVQAGHTLRSWLEDGTLIRDDRPGLYPYLQTYTYGGVTYRRRGFFCAVKLEEFESGGMIHPHEQTFSGPKEDRLKLMRATHANLSPVFGLFDDPTNDVTDLLFEAVRTTPPIAQAELPGGEGTVKSELWQVLDPAVIRDVVEMMADRHIYIADGHHRYTTCLTYRAEVSRHRGVPMTSDTLVDYALFAMVAMQDPGLIIWPTHRVVAAEALENFYLEGLEEAAAPYFDVVDTKLNGDSLAKLEKQLPGFGPHAIGVYDPILDTARVLVPKQADPLAAFADDPALAGKSAEWRALDVAILQHLVFERTLKPNFVPAGREMTWAFPHEAHEVAQMCRGGQYRIGFLLQPTPLTAVRELCNANELMPQKSTFFYPKLATGMVINLLE